MRIYVLHASMVFIWSDSRANERKRIFPLLYGCRLFFFINLNVLGFDLVVLGLKKRVLGFEKRVLGFEKNGTPLKQKNKNPLKIP